MTCGSPLPWVGKANKSGQSSIVLLFPRGFKLETLSLVIRRGQQLRHLDAVVKGLFLVLALLPRLHGKLNAKDAFTLGLLFLSARVYIQMKRIP